MDISAGYSSPIFQDFESYPRTEVDSVQDVFGMVSDEFDTSFISYELLPGSCTFKDLSAVLLRKLQSEIGGTNNTLILKKMTLA